MKHPAGVEPPYYAVIFTSRQRSWTAEYAETAERMRTLAALQPGYLGIESVRDQEGFGITVSYWQSMEAIAAWKRNLEHQAAQQQGRHAWYDSYDVRIARVERAYSFASGRQA